MPDESNKNKTFAVTQCTQILSHLKSGKSITGIGALGLFGVMHLPRRIFDLKERGNVINDKWITLRSKKRVKKYFMNPVL